MTTSIGREPWSTLVLRPADVSRTHATVEVTALGTPRVALNDNRSTNGTVVGEAAISEPTELPAERLFVIGDDVIQWLPLDRVDRSWTRGPDGHVEITRRHAAPRSSPSWSSSPASRRSGHRTGGSGRSPWAPRWCWGSACS